MRKTVLIMLSFLLILSGCSLFTFSETNSDVVRGDYVDVSEVSHFFKDYIPLRETFEGLGYDVNWQEETRMVEILKDNESVYVKAGDSYFLRNGVLVDGNVAPVIKSRRMYISVDALDDLFESFERIDSDTFRIYDGLVELDGELPKLKNRDEYDKLMSFYPYEDFNDLYYDDVVLEMAVEETAEVPAGDAMAKSEVSETNTQVEGVDEADIVKITNDYIFALKGHELQIIRTGRGELEIIHNVSKHGFYPQQLFVTDDKIILIGNERNTEIKTYEEGDRILTVPVYREEALMVKIFDITDLEEGEPELIKSFGVEGYYLSSRLVDDYVYVVANQYSYYGEPITPMILEQDSMSKTTSVDVAFEDVAYFPGHVNNNVLYTMGIDLNDLTLDGFDIDTYIGGGNTIYADRDSLYIALNANSGMWWTDWSESTDIFSFDLDKGKVDFKAKGNVPGYILNQFSMDEYKNHFRIATTRWGSEDVTKGNTTLNNLYILDEELKQVGAIDNLAPGERIYSTRMMGDQVYMVTYRQVDPFYVIDTSIPEEPKVLGYLKIPGYSNYMHPYDENTIIGVGMETKMQGGRVVNDGVKISLFDVSDFNNPVEKDKVILGTGNSGTDVSYDHKAFLFNKKKNILALPVRMVSEDYLRESTDAYIFSFTDDGMLNFRGAISHAAIKGGNDYYYDYGNSVTRIMYDGDDLYTLSENWLQLNDFDSLEAMDSLRR